MSEAMSAVVAGYAPILVGAWVHDPTDAAGTETNFPYADGRTESIKPKSAVLEVAGRRSPIVEFGEVTRVGFKLSIQIPFGPTHDAGVQWWRDACEHRRTLIYRDNRGRVSPVALPDGVDVTDGRIGSVFALQLTQVDYTPVV